MRACARRAVNGYRTMLDTNIISDLIRNPQGRAAERLREHGETGICVSIITAAELRYGAAKKGSARLLSRVEAVLSAIDVLPFDVPADTEYGGIRTDSRQRANRSDGPLYSNAAC